MGRDKEVMMMSIRSRYDSKVRIYQAGGGRDLPGYVSSLEGVINRDVVAAGAALIETELLMRELLHKYRRERQ